jgi:hypothetical protein
MACVSKKKQLPHRKPPAECEGVVEMMGVVNQLDHALAGIARLRAQEENEEHYSDLNNMLQQHEKKWDKGVCVC